MKIAVRGGHTERCTGAIGILNELAEDRKVKNELVNFLKAEGHSILDVTPPVNYTNNQGMDLAYGVNKANSWGADLFISVHFNKAYSSYDGAIGTECWVYSATDSIADEVYAKRIVDNIASLGFKNRGVKYSGNDLYECRETKMASVIIEVCFVEATKDVSIYRTTGYKAVAKRIAEGILNKPVGNSNSNEGEEDMFIFDVEQTFKNGDNRVKGKYCIATRDQYVYNADGSAMKINGKEFVLRKGTKIKMFRAESNDRLNCYPADELANAGYNGMYIARIANWDKETNKKRVAIEELIGDQAIQVIEKEVIKEVIKEVPAPVTRESCLEFLNKNL